MYGKFVCSFQRVNIYIYTPSYTLYYTTLHVKAQYIYLHHWLNGSMLVCRSGGCGAFPGRCRHMQFEFMLKMEVPCALPCP